MLASSLPWYRLIEGSDAIGQLAGKVATYRDSAAGFSIATAHIALLRQVGIPYSFRPRRHRDYPFGVFVTRKQVRQAKEIISRLGLGVDVAEGF